MRTPRNVYRIDIEPSDSFPGRHSTHGWQVRIRRAGTQHTKFFADAKYGDRDKALKAAEAFRDELMPTLPEADSATERSAQARSKTGVVGLSFCTKDDGSGNHKPYVQLSWTDNDRKRKTASYSVERWGLRKAVWNGVSRLHKERTELGRKTDEPQDMFATAYSRIVRDYPEHAGDD